MRCKSCRIGQPEQSLSAEMGIHFLGLNNMDKPVVWVFPEVVVCLNCGTAEFAVPEEELGQLASETPRLVNLEFSLTSPLRINAECLRTWMLWKTCSSSSP